jgi:hypothetical protein
VSCLLRYWITVGSPFICCSWLGTKANSLAVIHMPDADGRPEADRLCDLQHERICKWESGSFSQSLGRMRSTRHPAYRGASRETGSMEGACMLDGGRTMDGSLDRSRTMDGGTGRGSLGAGARKIGTCSIGAGAAAGAKPRFELKRFQRIGTGSYTFAHLRLGNGIADTDEHMRPIKRRSTGRYIDAGLRNLNDIRMRTIIN